MNKSIVIAVALGAAVVGVGTVAHLTRAVVAPHGAAAGFPAPAADAELLWTCGMHPQVVQDHPGTCPICHMRLTPTHRHGAAGDGHGGPPAVVIDAAVVQNMGVRTAEVTRGPLVRAVRTVGVLEAPEPGLHDINLKVGGWVERLYANQEGQHVHRGDRLFDLYSPDLMVAEEELAGAVRMLRAAGPAADPSVRRPAEALVGSAKRKLALLDVPEADVAAVADTLVVPGAVTFRSPCDGAVIDKAVVEGSAVVAGAKLMRIEDHHALWLDLQVYEDRMAAVAVGDGVEATLAAYPGRPFRGTVTFIHPHVDPMSRSVTARATLDNPDQTLRPGMYASATIRTRPVADAVQVPREAVIDTGTRQVAFVVRPAGHFEPRVVHMGADGDDGRVQILDGLTPGETVVTSGQFLLDVESRTAEAIDRLRATTGPPPMMAPPATSPMPTPPAAAAGDPTRPGTLTVVYCPMKKAEWLQQGEQVANPYFGTAMLDCGQLRPELALPPASSPLTPVLNAYLRVGAALAADKVDADADASLRVAAGGLSDPARADLMATSLAVAAAPDLISARSAFGSLSEAIIRASGPVPPPDVADHPGVGGMGARP